MGRRAFDQQESGDMPRLPLSEAEAIESRTGFRLHEQHTPEILQDGRLGTMFFKHLQDLRRKHRPHNVLTSFFTDDDGIFWLGVFVRPRPVARQTSENRSDVIYTAARKGGRVAIGGSFD